MGDAKRVNKKKKKSRTHPVSDDRSELCGLGPREVRHCLVVCACEVEQGRDFGLLVNVADLVLALGQRNVLLERARHAVKLPHVRLVPLCRDEVGVALAAEAHVGLGRLREGLVPALHRRHVERSRVHHAHDGGKGHVLALVLLARHLRPRPLPGLAAQICPRLLDPLLELREGALTRRLVLKPRLPQPPRQPAAQRVRAVRVGRHGAGGLGGRDCACVAPVCCLRCCCYY